jgi:hypothetical protein
VLSKISLGEESHHVFTALISLISFSPQNLKVNPGPATGNQTGEVSLWALVVRGGSSWQFCALLYFCLVLTSLDNHVAQTFFKCKSLWIIAYIVARQRDVARWISPTLTTLFYLLSEYRCTADDVRAVGWRLELIFFWGVSSPLLKIYIHRNTVP